MRTTLILFAILLLLFSATNYGGMRSPDTEIVFRVGESLAGGRGFIVDQELELWKGFGVTRGRGGELYAIFGPMQSVAAAPLVLLASGVNATRWYQRTGAPPTSFYVQRGLIDYLRLRPPSDRKPHALRFIVSFFNALISALCGVLFWLIGRRLVASPLAAVLATALFCCGSLLWPYAGTFFSEPLATLFLLFSLYCFVSVDPATGLPAAGNHSRRLLAAGIALGCAIATHLTALLFVPFFGVYSWYLCRGSKAAPGWSSLLAFLAGTAGMIVLLGLYNIVRFDSIFQTGRSVGMGSIVTTEYSRFVPPWRGLYGLLLSPGKGLLLFCPAVIAGGLAWRRFHQRFTLLSWVLAGALLSRLLFIAARSDWHGGFAHGPRYLLMAVPLCILPVLVWLQEQITARRLSRITLFVGFTLLCAWEQLYLSLGELFSYFQLTKLKYGELGVNIFTNDRLYLEWKFSPLLKLAGGRLAPFWLQGSPHQVGMAWLLGALLLLIAAATAVFFVIRRFRAADSR